MNSTCSTLSELTFFNWRQALCSALQGKAWLDFLATYSLKINPNFSALSFQDGFPNRWCKGALLLPIAAWAQGDKADLMCLAEKLSQQTLHTTLQNQPLDAYIQIEAPNRHFLTFTLSALAWAKLSLHTLSTSILPTATTCAAPSLRLIAPNFFISPAWRRAEYRLAWLNKADSHIHATQPLWLLQAIQLYEQPQLRQLLAQTESLCFYYVHLTNSKSSTQLPITIKRLEGQLNNLLKDFHDFYRSTKILSGDPSKQKALLNLAQAVGCALNLYNLRLTNYGSHSRSSGKFYS